MRVAHWVVLLSVAVMSSACGGSLSRARHAFDEGRPADAVDEFRAHEPDLEDPRYSLYRGLSHFACGDLRAASHWLARARAAEPGAFSIQEQGRLDAAWRSMGLMPGEPAKITSGLPAGVPERSEPQHASH